ncbi:MAG: hypothetical protein M1812_006711 [Candelaria pacifica]|nr:MAG: hypothetical protein M1812_006711 [Candelaria pacifica]
MSNSHKRHSNLGHRHSEEQTQAHRVRPYLEPRIAMDPPRDSERHLARRISYHSDSTARGSNEAVTSRSAGEDGIRNELRRGHSDGEVLHTVPGRPNTHSAAAESLQKRRESLNLAKTGSTNADSPYGKVLNDLHALHTEYDADRRKRARLGPINDRRLSTGGYLEGQGSSSRSQQRPHRSTSDSKAVAMGSSVSNVIDLTSPERPLPTRPSPHTGTTRDRRSREIVLPRWQPDTEVSKKCGRIVCANCSPHRITIPRQFIVKPPVAVPNSQPSAPGTQVVDLTDDSAAPNSISNRRGSRAIEGRGDPALGGGEEVRICNPCVPDPNLDPPPQRASQPIARARVSPPSSDDSSSSPEGPHSPIAIARRGPERPRTHSHSSRQSQGSVSSAHAPGIPRGQRSQDSRHEEALRREPQDRGGRPASMTTSRNYSDQSMPPPRFNVYMPEPQDRRHQGIYAPTVQDHGRDSSNPNAAAAVMSSRYPNPSSSAPTSNYIPSLPPTSRHRQNASTSSGRSAVRSMLDIDTPPPRPRPRLREEDICPICHSVLPPKGPNGSETAREQHVIDCISSHYSTSSPSSRDNQSTALSSTTATQAAIMANTATPTQASGNRDSQVLQRPRINHMLKYSATEKDCIGDEGEAQECVICFEEFAVGVEMASV